MLEELVEQYRTVETELIKLIFKKVLEGKDISYLANQLAMMSGIGEVNTLVRTLEEGSEEKVLKLLRGEKTDLSDVIQAYEEGVINIDPLKLNTTLEGILLAKSKDLDNGLSVIRSSINEAFRKEYNTVLTKAYIESLSGAYSYDESIRRAVRDLSDRGIRVAEYVREDGSVVNYNIESAVRRTLLTEMGDTANELQMGIIEELDCELVYVSQHIGARVTKYLDFTNHAHWQGRVYSRFGKKGKYEDFYAETGYGQIQGLKGVNCRHFVYPYFEGISDKPPKRIPMEANREVYGLNQEYNRLTRAYKKYKRRYEVFGEDKDRKRATSYSKERVAVRNRLKEVEQEWALKGVV